MPEALLFVAGLVVCALVAVGLWQLERIEERREPLATAPPRAAPAKREEAPLAEVPPRAPSFMASRRLRQRRRERGEAPPVTEAPSNQEA